MQDSNAIELPNYRTIFIDSNNSLYYLTPLEKIDDEIAHGQLDEEQIRDRKTINVLPYSDDGKSLSMTKIEYNYTIIDGRRNYTFKEEEIELKNSIAEFHTQITEKSSISLWIETCHFVVIKSTHTNRYWFLHYDPEQTQYSRNRITYDERDTTYFRANYSDLDPKIKYSLNEAHLGENEKIDVLVVHPEYDYDINHTNNMGKGRFDQNIFLEQIGKERVNSIQIIGGLNNCDFRKSASGLPKEFDINFYPASDRLVVENRENQTIVVEKNNCFPKHEPEQNLSPKTKNYSTSKWGPTVFAMPSNTQRDEINEDCKQSFLAIETSSTSVNPSSSNSS